MVGANKKLKELKYLKQKTMKSKLVILSLLLAGATAATAQTKETFYSESFKDNIFVSVGVGAQGCVNRTTLIMALVKP